jgi:hypothetical protein
MKTFFIFTLVLAFYFAKAQTTKVEAESFLTQTGIQLVDVNDEGATGKAVGYWSQGDFISFNINATKAGIYNFIFRLGSGIDGAQFEVRDETEKVLAVINAPNTGSHGAFADVAATIKLKAGKQIIKYTCVSNNIGADINWFKYNFIRDFGMPVITTSEDTVINITDIKKSATALLRSHAIDEDGSIVSYNWKKISGSGIIANANNANTTISGLSKGINVYQLTATDNDKKAAVQTVSITVKTCSGKKILISPVDGSGTGISIQATGYDKRKIHYPDPGYNPAWNFPKLKVDAGDTIALQSKYHWSFIELYGFEGTEGCPIVITSDTGVVHIDRGIKLVDAKYVKITGRDKNEKLSSYPSDAGKENFKIDIRGVDQINGKKGFGYGGIAVEIIGRSAHIEIDMIRAERKGYGVQAKQDPTCDTLYNYPNWIMDDIHIHHCFFKNILQDVLYLGNTDPLGTRQINCGTGIVYYKPIRLSNYNIHHNRILIANRTGIQLGGAEKGYNQIHHNYVSDCGYEFNQQQGAGISIGGMSRNVHVFDNIVKRTFLYGIFDLGADSSFVYNNYVDSSGYLDLKLYNPNMNFDSLEKRLGFAKVKKHFLLNNYQNGITNIQSTTKETFPRYTKTVFYTNNVLGVNTSKEDDKGIISFSEWGPATDWSGNSVVCGNTTIDGKEVTIERYNHKSKKWPVYTEDCNASPLNKKSKPEKQKSKSKGLSTTIIAGSAISIAVIAVIYFYYKKRMVK